MVDPERSRHDAAAGPVASGWMARQGPREARRRGALRLAVEVGANIRRRRTRRGLNQAQLGAAIGRDHSTVSRWESGERLPTLPALIALGRVLGCAPAALLPGEFGVGEATGHQDRPGRGEGRA